MEEKRKPIRKRPHQVIVRMDEKEFSQYKQRLVTSKMVGNSFGIRCLLGQQINVVENMPELIKQLKAAGNNLNQIARAANSGQIIPPAAVESLDEEVKKLWLWLKSVRVAKVVAKPSNTPVKTSTVEDLPAE